MLAATAAINRQQADTQKCAGGAIHAQVKSDQARHRQRAGDARPTPRSSRRSTAAPASARSTKATSSTRRTPPASSSLTQLQPISVLFNLPQQNLTAGQRRVRQGPAHRRCAALRQRRRDRPRHAYRGRQPGRSNHRHGASSRRISQRRPAALARPVRQCPAADRHAQAGRRDPDRRGAARTERHVRLCRQGRQHVAMRPSPCRSRTKPRPSLPRASMRRRARRHHRLRAADRRRQSHDQHRRRHTAGSPPAGTRRARSARRQRQAPHSTRPTARAHCGTRRARRPRRSRNERLLALHPPPDRDFAARRRGDAGRHARLLVAAGLGAAAGRFPDHPGHDAAPRRQSRHHRRAGDGAARTPVRPDPVAGDDDVVEFVRHQPDHAAIRSDRATSTPPRRTCNRRSMPPARRCRATCPTRRSIRR